jgi:hypothetical protein
MLVLQHRKNTGIRTVDDKTHLHGVITKIQYQLSHWTAVNPWNRLLNIKVQSTTRVYIYYLAFFRGIFVACYSLLAALRRAKLLVPPGLHGTYLDYRTWCIAFTTSTEPHPSVRSGDACTLRDHIINITVTSGPNIFNLNYKIRSNGCNWSCHVVRTKLEHIPKHLKYYVLNSTGPPKFRTKQHFTKYRNWTYSWWGWTLHTESKLGVVISCH